MRIMIAAGGTGGHVYPAIAIAAACLKLRPAAELTFVGSVGGFERPLLEAAAIRFVHHDEVRAGPLHGVNPLRALVSVIELTIGTLQALLLVMRRRPRALLLTGGWVGLPVALAAWILRVPSLIYLPDIEPGLTIRVLRRFATRVAVTAEDSAPYFRPGQMIVTGYPLREEIVAARGPDGRAQAQTHFDLDPARQTLLVFGGSRGARTINAALVAIRRALLADGLQIIHVTGTLDWPEISAQRDGDAAADPDLYRGYHAFPYLHDDMGWAFAAADLVVCRAGAST
ncbi:MAG: UDP-N-acetylglucosamine--N-acetylmuramyl-(pentapeptide) pyrophosphoryl-undecaprenol N-acetylglucosamine transferase, partial [Chloroflexi bacterium]|nr:UDP-N-acetylglucosamine--N-acetylmuramyl-(pentapeptide) pyrophosphoryl-undecaprenol N-acetylglucosamine transferase [Chloroflexota bacterium]